MSSTGGAIQSALKALHRESVEYWDSLDTGTFLTPIGDAWSPADNFRHLTKSMRAVTQGLRVPRVVLCFAFGRASAPSRPYASVREIYRALLTQGASVGRFAPRPQAAPSSPEAARRLPHPLLGRLTIREMLLFTVYHNRHHLENVQRRFASVPMSTS